MNKLNNPGAGTAPILVLFVLVAFFVNSWIGNGSAVAQPGGKNQVVLSADSSSHGGTGTGGGPKLNVMCTGTNCNSLNLGSFALAKSVASTGGGAKYGLEAKAMVNIKAGTIIHLELQLMEVASAKAASRKVK